MRVYFHLEYFVGRQACVRSTHTQALRHRYQFHCHLRCRYIQPIEINNVTTVRQLLSACLSLANSFTPHLSIPRLTYLIVTNFKSGNTFRIYFVNTVFAIRLYSSYHVVEVCLYI